MRSDSDAVERVVEALPSDAGRRTLRSLLSVISDSPVPTTPLAQMRHLEERGLALLELSSRFDHVKRQSEHLVLVDRGHLHRSISLDVDLSRLSTRHFRALGGPTAAESDSAQVWIPIANQFRGDLAPVVVRDASSIARSRMTLHEMVAASSAALVKLFRMLLDATPEADRSSDELHRLKYEKNRSRWLIESSIGSLIEAGPSSRRVGNPAKSAGVVADKVADSGLRSDGPASVSRLPSEAEAVREFAVTALSALQRSQPNSFLAFIELLCAATEEYPLAVLLDPVEANVFLTYDAPLLPAQRSVSKRRSPVQYLKPLLSPVRTFNVSYLTTVSRSTSSHHVTLQVPEQIHVRRFFMSSDADAPLVGSLIGDMEGVADHFLDLQSAGEKLLENELQSIAARIAEISARRALDARRYDRYLADKGVKAPHSRHVERNESDNGLDDFVNGHGSPLAALDNFSHAFQDGKYTRLAAILTPQKLRSIARIIRELQLSDDLTVDNDPREHGAHAHWSRRPTSKDAHVMEPVRTLVHVSLVDDPPSLAGSVSRMLLALILVVYTLLSVLMGDWYWFLPWRAGPVSFAQADATVAVLLLVPGLLLTRLDIPATNTVLGQIRLLPRIIAYSAVGVLALMAAAVATGAEIDSRSLSLLFGVLFLLTLITGCIYLVARRGENDTAPRGDVMPAWVRAEFDNQLESRLSPASVSFEVTRRHKNAK